MSSVWVRDCLRTSRRPGATILSLVAGLLLAPAAAAQTPAQSVASVVRIGADLGGFGTGLAAKARFGTAVASLGDLDGDGLGDLAAGAPGSQPGIDPPGGVLWILFLEKNGTVRAKLAIGAGLGGFRGALDEGDDFGWSVANLGDLDGDGVVDLAVGARRDDDGGTSRGAVWILFLRTDGTVKAEAKISGVHGGFDGQLANQDRFGVAVAPLGDFDGDGIPDLAVGADGADDGQVDAGAIWLLLLLPDGSVREHHRISATAGGFTGALAVNDRFGSALAALGDQDGDGVLDLAVGSPRALDVGGQASGAIWLLFLATDGSVREHVRISDGESGFTGPVQGGNAFGRSLIALGDLDGDGNGDLAVGEPQENDDSEGRVWVLLLDEHGAVLGQRLIQDSPPSPIPGPQPPDTLPGPPLPDDGDFGAALAALGDHDGNGRADLAVGSPLEPGSSPPILDQGRVRVVFLGPQDATPPALSIAEQGQQLMATGLARDDGTEDENDSGLLEDGEDDNGNGLLDTDAGLAEVWLEIGAVNLALTVEPLLPGSPQAPFRLDVIDGQTLAAGTVAARDVLGNVKKVWVELQPGTLQTRIGEVIEHSRLEASTPGLEGALSADDRFGAAVAVLGDLDGDGVPDLAVAATNDVGSTFRGTVWILFMAPDGTVRARQAIGADAGGFTGQPDEFGGFGSALAALPDLDGDGVIELAVGEPRADGDGVDQGAVWILFLRPDGTVARHAQLGTATGLTGLVSRDAFGTSLAVLPDLDGNGLPDLAVGAPDQGPFLKDPGGFGHVWILSLDGDGAVVAQQQLVHAAGNPVGGTRFGSALAVLPDLDGNGMAELAVASDLSGLSALGLRIAFLDEAGAVVSEMPIGDFDDDFGLPVSAFGPSALASAGDVDGDGVGDLVASFSTGLPVGTGSTGSAWVLLLLPDGSVRDVRPIAEGHSDFLGDLQPSGTFGASAAALGDLDGDGCTDLAVGAPLEDEPEHDVGAVWLLHLHTVIDTRPPLVKPELVAEGTLDAFDDRPSEDVDGSEHLKPHEDTNGNERIDQDSGIASIALDAGASNLLLIVDAAFVPGTVHARFGVELADPTQPGTGVVLVRDVAGNVGTCTVAIPAAKPLKR